MSKGLQEEVQNSRKGILTFDLPEHDWEFETAVKAIDYRLFAESLYNDVFRPILKYGAGVEEHKLDIDTVQYLADRVLEKLTEDLSEHTP